MNNIVFRRSKPDDFYNLDLLPIYSGDKAAKQRALETSIDPNSKAYTLLRNGAPIAVMGFTMIYSKVAEIWALIGKEAVEHYIYYVRWARALINFEMERLGVARVQMYMQASQKNAVRFANFLGLELECVLRKYGEEGVDYYQFAKVV